MKKFLKLFFSNRAGVSPLENIICFLGDIFLITLSLFLIIHLINYLS